MQFCFRYLQYLEMLGQMITKLSNYFVGLLILLKCWNFNGFIYQHFKDLLKVLDRALSNYLFGLLDFWKFNAFIYQHFEDLLKVLDRAYL